MSPTIMWPVLAAVAVLAIILAVAAAKARAKAREEARDKARDEAQAAASALQARTVEPGCARSGHLYRPYGTGLHCLRCGNFAARIEGEAYGPAEGGLVERRREPR